MNWPQHIDDLTAGDFEGWFQEEIRPFVQPMVIGLLEEAKEVLRKLQIDATADEGLERDRWALFEEHSEKSASSVKRKVANDLTAAGRDRDAFNLADLRRSVLDLGDLGRFRVVGALPRDVRRVRPPLLGLSGASDRVKDFVRDVSRRAPLLGHRAVQFTVARGGVRAEIQIMTSLQHAWDRRNHCFYEWLREGNGGEGTLDLRIDDHAVAEALHVADQMADHNFASFLAMRGQK